MSRGEAVTEAELLQKLDQITGDTVVDYLHVTMYGACLIAARTGKCTAYKVPSEFNWPDVNESKWPDKSRTLTWKKDYVDAMNRTWRRGIGMGRLQAFDTNVKAHGVSIAAAIDALDDLPPNEV